MEGRTYPAAKERIGYLIVLACQPGSIIWRLAPCHSIITCTLIPASHSISQNHLHQYKSRDHYRSEAMSLLLLSVLHPLLCAMPRQLISNHGSRAPKSPRCPPNFVSKLASRPKHSIEPCLHLDTGCMSSNPPWARSSDPASSLSHCESEETTVRKAVHLERMRCLASPPPLEAIHRTYHPLRQHLQDLRSHLTWPSVWQLARFEGTRFSR